MDTVITRSTNSTNELNFNRYGRNFVVSPVLFLVGVVM